MAKTPDTPEFDRSSPEIGVNALARFGVLTRDQMATALNVDKDTLARWEEENDFPGRTVGRTTFYDIESIKTWIAEGGK